VFGFGVLFLGLFRLPFVIANGMADELND